MMVFAQSYTVAWVIVMELAERQNMRGIHYSAALFRVNRQATNSTGIVVHRLDDTGKQSVTNVIAVITAVFAELSNPKLTLCLSLELFRLIIEQVMRVWSGNGSWWQTKVRLKQVRPERVNGTWFLQKLP